MVAVIKVAGQQYKVEKDQTLFVPHLSGNAGDKVALEVLLVDADGKLNVGSGTVNAEIVDHVKGDTVIAYKQKKKKRFSQKERSSYRLYKD